MSEKKYVKIAFTPVLYPLYKQENEIVVVVDVLRATTAICTAIHHGMTSVIPVQEVEDAHRYTGSHYVHAAERGGAIVEGFSFGNSPLSYINNPDVKGKTLVLTTTNGTQAIHAAKGSAAIVTGAFSNITVLTSWLSRQPHTVCILCAGWKNRFNLEDSLFAGALTERLLQNGFELDVDSDAPYASMVLYQQAAPDVYAFLGTSSHRKRLSKLDLDDDIRYSLECDVAPVVPCLKGEELVDILRIS